MTLNVTQWVESFAKGAPCNLPRARRGGWRLLLDSVPGTLVPDSSSPWKNRLQTVSQTPADPSGVWLPHLAHRSVGRSVLGLRPRRDGWARFSAVEPTFLHRLSFHRHCPPRTFTNVLCTASTLALILYLYSEAFLGLKARKSLPVLWLLALL